MGSISVIAEALHSLLDLVAAIIAFVAVRFSAKPADWEHPFGHGKAEPISAGIEALLIFPAAIIIVYEGVNRLISGATLEFLELGIGVMLFSTLVNAFVSRQLFRTSKRFDSLALEADAWHLSIDVLTSVGVLFGLVVVRLTGLNILDPIMAIAVALLITKAAYDLVRKSIRGLLDVRLPSHEEKIIRETILEHGRDMVGFHKLRTRKSGNTRFVELHLVLTKDTHLEQAHQLCNHLEADIASKLPNSQVTIHCEPPGEHEAETASEEPEKGK
mgnify:CR=1 FL=1